MSDMTREEAISRLKEGEPFSEIYDSSWNEALDMAISVLSENKGEWIPVSKRLPEAGHVVYCQLIDGSHEILFLDVYSDGQMTWVGRMMRDYKVTAWREMPEPYKGE